MASYAEYFYRVLENHQLCCLPEQAGYMIRFHSFYPWHTGKDYMHLCNERDLEMLKWVKEFKSVFRLFLMNLEL